MNLYSIYMYTGPTGKRYIGLTKDLVDRHRRHADHKHSKCRRFANAIAHYGINAFTRTIMETDLTLAQANERERYWIALLSTQHPNGYNLTNGGDTATMSPESREKQASKMRGKKQTAEQIKQRADAKRGKKFTAAQREVSSAAKKKMWEDPEYRAKQMAWRRRGRQVPAEARAKMAEAARRRQQDEEYKARRSADQMQRWADPEYRERQMKARADAKARKLAVCMS